MKKLLFICSGNRLRSPTAEAVFSKWPNIEAMSAGLNHDAELRVSAEMIEWADAIFVMEPAHKKNLTKQFNGPPHPSFSHPAGGEGVSTFSSPEGEGFPPSPNETLIRLRRNQKTGEM